MEKKLSKNSLTYKDTAQYLKNIIGNLKIDFLIILGSGLNTVLEDIKKIHSITYSEIKGMNLTTVSGHLGILDICEYDKKIIAIMRGRLHTYEDNTCDDVVRLPRALAELGAKYAILTNASGSTSLKNKPTEIMIITDHLNMTGLSPLGTSEAKLNGEQFIDMLDAYSKKFIKQIKKIAQKFKIKISTGVYAWMKGPQYETASEVKMLKNLGASVVGMSTVPEVIALHQFGVTVACLSTVTNYGTGVKRGHKLTHEEVKINGRKLSNDLNTFIKKIIQNCSI